MRKKEISSIFVVETQNAINNYHDILMGGIYVYEKMTGDGWNISIYIIYPVKKHVMEWNGDGLWYYLSHKIIIVPL